MIHLVILIQLLFSKSQSQCADGINKPIGKVFYCYDNEHETIKTHRLTELFEGSRPRNHPFDQLWLAKGRMRYFDENGKICVPSGVRGKNLPENNGFSLILQCPFKLGHWFVEGKRREIEKSFIPSVEIIDVIDGGPYGLEYNWRQLTSSAKLTPDSREGWPVNTGKRKMSMKIWFQDFMNWNTEDQIGTILYSKYDASSLQSCDKLRYVSEYNCLSREQDRHLKWKLKARKCIHPDFRRHTCVDVPVAELVVTKSLLWEKNKHWFLLLAVLAGFFGYVGKLCYENCMEERLAKQEAEKLKEKRKSLKESSLASMQNDVEVDRSENDRSELLSVSSDGRTDQVMSQS